MDKLRFGTAGIPLSTPLPRSTLAGIKQVRTLNLNAMELEFVRRINVTEETASVIKQAAKEHDVLLTCHGQYFINLNAKDPATLAASVQRILTAADMANNAGAWSICYHIAYYMKDPTETVFQRVKQQVKQIVAQLKDTGNPIWLRPETGGKINQFADIDDLIRLSQEVEQVLPCIDWAHHYARTNGRVNNKEEFSAILAKLEKHLGRQALDNMHMHIEGIEYTERGERCHRNFDESGFNYKDLMSIWKEFKIKGVAISESPNIETDALTAKEIYTLA